MLKFIVLLAFISACYAASIGVDSTTEKKEVVPVLRFETDKKPDGSFSFSYEGGDRSFREETGVIENAGTDDEALEVSGSYRYIDSEGQEVEVHYTAGKNGFVPVGTNILSEISALARAAADLPNNVEEESVNRKARSKDLKEKDEITEKKPVKKQEPEVKVPMDKVLELKVAREIVPVKKSEVKTETAKKVEKEIVPVKKPEEKHEPTKKVEKEIVPVKKPEEKQELAKKVEKDIVPVKKSEEKIEPAKKLEKENVPEKKSLEPVKKVEKAQEELEKKTEKVSEPAKKEEKVPEKKVETVPEKKEKK